MKRTVSRMITLDTYAWVEYLLGSEKGRAVSAYLDSEDIVFTPTISLNELKVKFLREKVPEAYQKKSIEKVRKRSLLMPLDDEIALKAAEFRSGGLPLVDAIIYATALRNDTNLLTGDKHFEKYEKVTFLR